MTAAPNDKLIRKIVEVLDKLGISQHDCILAEKYLNEEVGLREQRGSLRH